MKESIVITPDKMVDFYTCNLVEGEPLDWKSKIPRHCERYL